MDDAKCKVEVQVLVPDTDGNNESNSNNKPVENDSGEWNPITPPEAAASNQTNPAV